MNIFPVPIKIVELSDIDNESLIDYAYNLKQNDNGRTVSNKGGWQSNNINFDNVSGLMTTIMSHMAGYCATLNVKEDCYLSYTNTWININSKHSYNIPHLHSGFISGVYYMQAAKGMGDLVLHNPDKTKDLLWNQEWFKELNNENCGTFHITPKSGLLVLFPAWLEHSVEMNTFDEDRISLSFNTKIENANH